MQQPLGAILLLAAACLAAAQQQSIEALFNVSIPGIPLLAVNASGLNATLLRQRLDELATTVDPAFANALIGEITTILSAAGVTVTECPVGTYTDPQGLLCAPCPAGTYSTQPLASSVSTCQLCPKGTYSNATAAASLDTCLPCPPNSFGAVAGAANASQCQGCPAHSVAPTGAQSIAACVCQAGYYAAVAGGACTPCPAGSYCTQGAINQCPSPGASDSLPLAAAASDCFCRPGYSGQALWGCMQCWPGSYCPGGPEGLSLPCPASSTSDPGAVALADCNCGSGYSKSDYEKALRTLSVTAAPCVCAAAYPCPALGQDCAACAEGAGCPNGTTLTCRQGAVELPLVNRVYEKSRAYEWTIAPEGDVQSITLTFSAFCTGNVNDKLLVQQCTTPACTDAVTILGSLSLNGAGLTGCSAAVPSSTRRTTSSPQYRVMRLRWTSGASVTALTNTDFTGWKAAFATTLACNASALDTHVDAIEYRSSGTFDPAPPQLDPGSPFVLWIGDTLSLPASSTGVAVDVSTVRGAAFNPDTSPRYATYGNMWLPQYPGRFYLLDLAYPARALEIVVAPADPTTWDIYLDLDGTGAFALSGDVQGILSPTVYATVGDTLSLSRVTAALAPAATTQAALDPYRLLLATATAEIPDGTLGVLGQRSLHITWDTAQATQGTYYYVAAATPAVRGRIVLTARARGLTCTPCQPNEYCPTGQVIDCPANSHSPPMSVSADACACDAGYFAATTDVAAYYNSQNLDTGGRHTCAVTNDRQLYCWGANELGQLGLGTRTPTEPPTLVPGLAAVESVALGGDFTCATYAPAPLATPVTRRVKCWGGNAYGQLGQDSPEQSSGTTLPAALPDTILGSVAVPAYHTVHLSCADASCCAFVQFGASMQNALKCWGANTYGQLGWSGFHMGTGYTVANVQLGRLNPSAGYMVNAPLVSTGIHAPAMSSVGGDHACALLDSGDVQCWGLNKNGAVGAGASGGILVPTTVNLNGARAKAVNCYAYVCCVVLADTYHVKCWGQGEGGRLGVGFYNIGETQGSMGANLPSVALGTGVYAMDVNVGLTQTCALLGNNHVRCWGSVAGHTVGTNPALQMDEYLPDISLQSGRVALQIAGKGATTCAILSNYRVACWGANTFLQLGSATPGLVAARRLLAVTPIPAGATPGLVAARRLLAVTPIPANQTNMTVVPLPAAVDVLHTSGTRNTLVCSPCQDNNYCPGAGVAMAQCPAHSASPPQSTAQSNCYCVQGYAANATASTCSLCTGPRYCALGAVGTCPQFATTVQDGAYDLANCSCAPGYTGASGAACSPCPTGTFKAAVGPANCSQCPAGTASSAQALNASAGCAQCPQGTFSVAGAMQCTPCQAGSSSPPGASACGACPIGTYAAEASGACIPCPVGFYNNDPSGAGLLSCKRCVAGTYSNATGANSSDTCLHCPAGQISQGGVAACSPCPLNTYSYSGTGECLQCPLNASSLPGSAFANCTCAAGFYRNYEADHVTFTCSACPAGAWSALGALQCTSCPAGTAQPNTTVATPSACVACQAGNYAPQGSPACQACPAWSYALASAGQCTNCSIGYYTPAKSSACSACPAGKYSFDQGISTLAECKACLPGFYCPGVLASPNNQLIQCPLGTYSASTSAKTVSQCLPCAANYYCPIASLQLPCPTGTASNASSTSQLQCVCAKGYSCSYTKVVQAVVTLVMTPDEFNLNPAVRAAFIAAVASSAKTAAANVNIVSIRDTLTGQTQTGRRLLQLEASLATAHDATKAAEPDTLLHVFLQVSHASEIRDLDLHLFSAGLDPAFDSAFMAPHAVVAVPI